MKALLLGLCVAAGCGKTANPEVCCTDPADCSSIGAAEDKRDCPDGLACVEHECVVADCSTQGCTPQAPVCNVATSVCEGCKGNPDCATSQGQPLCDVDSGSCVQCVTSNDCGPTVPVCAGQMCRKCERDAECASGACDDTGQCVADSSIVHVDVAGTDAGDCNKAAPCATVAYAVGKTSTSRRHVVLRTGSYTEPASQIVISSTTTPADRVVVHGNGSRITATSGEPLLSLRLPTTIRDLTLETTVTAVSVERSTTLEHVTIKAGSGAFVGAPLRAVDLHIEASIGLSLNAGGTLDMDTVVIRATDSGIEAPNVAGTSAQITNLVISGARNRGLQLPFTSGKISFATIVDNGTQITSGGRSVVCGPDMTINASIVWDSSPQSLAGNCILNDVIAGPAAIPGAMSIDPLFKDRNNADYHLSSNSPAIDRVMVGPTTDFEGEPRPQGVRWDLGADEAQ